jgi:putative phosphoesterase
MRIVVISDTHGNVDGASLLLSTVAGIDLVVHLGDHIADIWALAADLPCPVVGVLGNEDRAEPGPSELVIPAAGAALLALHGHLFDLNPYLPKDEWERRMDELVAAARREHASAVLFGHTHRPYLEQRGGILLVNPGEIYPGSESSSMAVLTVTSGDIAAEIQRFDRKFNREVLFSYPHD